MQVGILKGLPVKDTVFKSWMLMSFNYLQGEEGRGEMKLVHMPKEEILSPFLSTSSEIFLYLTKKHSRFIVKC